MRAVYVCVRECVRARECGSSTCVCVRTHIRACNQRAKI